MGASATVLQSSDSSFLGLFSFSPVSLAREAYLGGSSSVLEIQ